VGTTTRTPRNIYILDEVIDECHYGKDDESWLWHKRLGHINFDNVVKLKQKDAIRGLPELKKKCEV